MAKCEIVTDVLNSEPIGDPPAPLPNGAFDAAAQEQQRNRDQRIANNITKRFLYRAVRGFLITNGRLAKDGADQDIDNAENPDPGTYNVPGTPFAFQTS